MVFIQRMNRIFFLILLFCSTNEILAQQYAFGTYSTAEGLPQSQVTSITEDEQGYLWIGTLGGLGRFNGLNFKSYTSEDGLLNNRIYHLSRIDDMFWVGHEGGISFKKGDRFLSYALPLIYSDVKVVGIRRFKNDLIVATNGAGLFILLKNKLVELQLQGEEERKIRDIEVIGDRLFLATRNGMLITNDLKNFEHIDQTYEITMSGVEYVNDEVVCSSFGEGLFYLDKGGRFKRQDRSIPEEYRINSLSTDKSGHLWMSSQLGVLRRLSNGRIEYLDESKGLPINLVASIYEDRNGTIWIGSQGKGLLRFSGEQFAYFDTQSGLPSELFLCGTQKSSGDLLLGTLDKGAIQFSSIQSFKELAVPYSTVWCVSSGINNADWYGTEKGLIEIDAQGRIKEYSIEQGLAGSKVTSILKVDSQHAYLGGSGGVTLYENGKFTVVKGSTTIGTVRDLSLYDNTLYVASDKGLFVKTKEGFSSFRQFNKVVYSLAKDEADRLWVGTQEGLYFIHNDSLRNWTLSDEPSSNYINFLQYRKDFLYVGTNNGLFILQGLSQNRIWTEHFGLNEGLVDLETNLNSAFFDREGNLWFGTASGLVRFHKKSRSSTQKPVLYFTSLLVNFQRLSSSTYSNGFLANGFPKALRLPYSKNNLQFEVEGVQLEKLGEMAYQYWLEGLDESWSPPSSSSKFNFNSLQPGDYILHVRMIGPNEVYSEELQLPFRINTAFYKTWWFITLLALVAFSMILLFFRMRLKRERERYEKEQLIFKSRLINLEQQSLNASMNRHFIFNALNSIQFFINSSDKLAANKYLSSFAKLIRKNLDSSTVDGNLIPLSQEIERLELYLSLEAMRFKGRFEYRIELNGLDLEEVMIPAMILQPFVENSIIHGILPNYEKEGLIEVEVYKTDEDLVVRMQDNGIGIDNSLKRKKDAEGDHQSHGMEITMKRIDLIKKVSDQALELDGPKQLYDAQQNSLGTVVYLKIPLKNLEV